MNARKHFSGLTLEEAIIDLRDTFPPGSTAYTILRHVSSSGMSRAIDVVAVGNGEPRWMSPRVGVAIDSGWSDKYEALSRGGCGTDMGFDVVYSMSRAIYSDNGPVPLRPIDKRRLTRWAKRELERSPHHANTDPGYAVSQRWI